MSYHNRLTKINNRRSQISKEERALEIEQRELVRKYDTRRKIFCGAVFLKKIFTDLGSDMTKFFVEELKKAPARTQEEFPELLGKENHVLPQKVKITDDKY